MKKILVVDDNERILHFFKKIFSKEGLDVRTAKNAKEALSIIDDSFSLVTSDFEMPGMNGAELCIEIKKRFGKRMPVIIVSSMIGPKRMVQIKKSGADDILDKTFGITPLVNSVKRII
jgi:DNA-binding response OmpR family regulator